MKRLFLIMALTVSSAAFAGTVTVKQTNLGSGMPGQSGTTEATPVMDGMYHAPQYMPGHPTAATIYPRVVDVECSKDGAVLNCDGYNYEASLGRTEYLLVRPRVKSPPVVITKEVPVLVHKEVPQKRGLE